MTALQSRYFLRILVSIMFLAASAVSIAPRAAHASSGLYPTMGYAAMNPWGGSPYMQSPQCGMTGQMPGYGQCGVDPMAVFYGLNWGGAQPLGASYMTPIGLSSMMNSYNHTQMMSRMSTAAY